MSRPPRPSGRAKGRGSTRNSRGEPRNRARTSKESWAAKKAAIGRVNLSLDFIYDEEEDKIIIPAGLNRFIGIGYRDRYPEIWAKVAGITMAGRPQIVRQLVAHKLDGDLLEVEIVEEANNKYDPHAKLVVVTATSKNSKNTLLTGAIGYLPKELAKLLTEIKERYSMIYIAKLDKIRSDLTQSGKEMGFPCSAAITLTPRVEKELPRAPKHRVIALNSGSKEDIRNQFRPKRNR